MNIKTIATVALNNKDYPSFEAKLTEAVKWTDFAARAGADLVVLPEGLNLYYGDGDPNLSMAETALTDWQAQTRPLFECAIRNRIALTIPVFIRESNQVVNCFHLISSTGKVLGRYEKVCPTVEELRDGVRPGRECPLIDWDGIKVGGAICFDVYFSDVFTRQADAGAQLFLMPSLTPGGGYINYYAMKLGVPIALAYPAYSRIVDLDGRELDGAGYRYETLRFGFGAPVAIARINFDRVVLFANHNQEKIVEIQQAHGADVGVKFDQENCTFVLESRSANLSVAELIKRYDLIPQREYFPACRKKIREHVG